MDGELLSFIGKFGDLMKKNKPAADAIIALIEAVSGSDVHAPSQVTFEKPQPLKVAELPDTKDEELPPGAKVLAPEQIKTYKSYDPPAKKRSGYMDSLNPVEKR